MAHSTDKPGQWPRARSARYWESLAASVGTPFYAYDRRVLAQQARVLREAFFGTELRYAMKANANPALLRAVADEKIGIDAVSAWEARLAHANGHRRSRILYTGNFPSDDELRAIASRGIVANLDALSAIDRYGKIAKGSKIAIRVDLERGAGHHPHVVTAGVDSKFGLAREDLPAALEIVRKRGLRLVGLHQHIGSGLCTDAHREVWLEAADALFDLAISTEKSHGILDFIDVGGGFGVAYPDDAHDPDLAQWGRSLSEAFVRRWPSKDRRPRLLIEPGRSLVAACGALITRVTTIKPARDRVWVGVDAGMHTLVRPAMYGSYHPIWPVRERKSKPTECWIVGPICESGDVLAERRGMPLPREGDLLVIGMVGAYGYAMASTYNLRPKPAELLIDGDRWEQVTRASRYAEVCG